LQVSYTSRISKTTHIQVTMDKGASNSVGGYYTGMFIIGLIMLFIAVANLALGIANAVICGFLGSIGYGIWGSALVRNKLYKNLKLIVLHLKQF
jgi:hypothetical protein